MKRLQRLLENAAHGLHPAQFQEVTELIRDSEPLNGKVCWVCKIAADLNHKYKPKEAIYEKGICKDHALGVLGIHGISYK